MGILDAPMRPTTSRANTIVWLGDSLTAQANANGTGVAQASYSPVAFWPWAQTLTGHRLRTLKNAGVAGERTDQILARIDADVLAYSPGWCHELSGTNDVGQGVALATIQANKTNIWDRLDAAGIRIITGTVPPRSTYTGSQKADAEKLNAWIKDQGLRRKNLIVVDYYAALVDIGSTGAYQADATSDGIHSSTAGAYRMGRLLATELNKVLVTAPFLSASEGDSINLLSRGRFSVGGAGSTPTGWSGAPGSPTLAKVARTDGVNGSWQSVVVANGSNTYLQANVSVNGTTLSVGDQVICNVEYQISGLDAAAAVQSRAFYLELQSYNGTTATSQVIDSYWVPTASVNMPSDARSGVLRTPAFTVPSGTTLMLMLIRMFGGGTYLLDRAGLFNLTQNAIAA